MYHFQIGETAVIVAADGQLQLIGTQVTVTAPLRERPIAGGGRLHCYVIALPSGIELTAHPRCLGKYFERGAWSDIKHIWQPNREREA